MNSNLSESEIRTQIAQLQKGLEAFPEQQGFLDLQLETATKHLPVYLKILKGHLQQIPEDTGALAEPVLQLVELFQSLKDGDIQLLENLLTATRALNDTNAQAALSETAVTA